jgi:uncharacterized protein (DUF2384 family)
MDASPTLDRDEVMLARVAELDLSLAEKLHAAAMAAEDPADVADLARAYQKIARSLRQSIALKARLKRDLAGVARDEMSPAEEARVEQRAAVIRKAVTRVIFTETEGEAADWLCGMLEDSIELRIRRSAAADNATLDETVIELCDDLNLSQDAAERWRELPDPKLAEERPASGKTLELSG